MIEVFKTNVMKICDAEQILVQIQAHFCHYQMNFDLEDCDKIFRVDCEGEPDYAFIKAIFQKSGFIIEALS